MQDGDKPVYPECSTPFGINGGNTVNPVRDPCQLRSAQRLSASTEGTHRDVQRLRMWSTCTCSTPFGINGGNTALLATPDRLPGYEATFQASPRLRRQLPGTADQNTLAGSRRSLRTSSNRKTYARGAAFVKHLPASRNGKVSLDANTLGRRFPEYFSTTRRSMILLLYDFETGQRLGPTRLVARGVLRHAGGASRHTTESPTGRQRLP